MAVELASAYVSIIPTTKGIAGNLEKELVGPMNAAAKKAGDEAGATMKKSLADTGKSFTNFGIGALAVAAGIGAGLLATGKSASDLGESVNAVKVTFGKAADGILKLGEDAATSVGLSNAAFNGLAVQFSSFATTIAGKGGDVVATMQELTGRAADFASVMNIDVAEAARVFQSGLAGETEPLKKFGIDLSDTAVKAFAASHGIGEFGAQLTEQEKVTARYGLLMEQTNKTQGDFANTSDSAANATRIAKAELENASASLGAAFTPAIAFAATTVAGLAEKFVGLNDATGGWLAKGAGIVAIAVGAAGALSLVVGQAIKMHDNFSKLKVAFVNAEGGLTKVGSAAKTGAIALGAAGIALAAYSLRQQQNADNAAAQAAALDEVTRAADSQAEQVGGVLLLAWQRFDDLSPEEAVKRLATENQAAAIRIRDLAAADAAYAAQLESQGITVDMLTSAISDEAAAVKRSEEAATLAAAATEDLGTDTALTAEQTDILKQNADALVTAIIEEKKRLDDLAQAERDNNNAIAAGIAAQRELTAERRDAIPGSGDLAQSVRDLDSAYYDLRLQEEENIKTQKDHKLSQDEKDQSNRDLATSENDLGVAVFEMAQEYATAEGAVKGTKREQDLMTASLEAAKAKYPELVGLIDGYIAALNNIPKSVDTVIRAPIGGGLDRAATGGAHTGPTIVGEEGPEIVDLPSGSYVHTAAQTRAMLSSAATTVAGGSPIVVNNYRRDIGVGDLNQILAMARLAA